MSRMFKQCDLVRPIDGGVETMSGWIPAQVSIVNKVVRLKDSESGRWTAGWTVLAVAEPGMPAKVLEKNSRDYLKTRDASDI